MRMPWVEWKPVVGWEGVYEVSESGLVRRVKPIPNPLTGRSKQPSGIPLKMNPDGKGYLMVGLRDAGRFVTCKVAALVAAAFIGPRPDGFEIDHKDMDKRNNSVSNLEYVTGRENMRRASLSGRCAKKLTAEQVSELKRLREAGWEQDQLASRFGINQSTVSRILSGARWVTHEKECR